MSSIPEDPVRQVIFHTPGPAWDKIGDPASLVSLMAHARYLQKALRNGLIEFSGPFLKEGVGGMILTASGVTAEQAQAMGDNDPAVKSGLVRFEVRPWMLTVRGAS